MMPLIFFQIAMYQCEILLQRCFRNSEHTIHVLEEARIGQKDYRLLTTWLNQKTQRNVNCILKFPLMFCISFRNFGIQFMIMLTQLIAPCSFYLSSMTAAMNVNFSIHLDLHSSERKMYIFSHKFFSCKYHNQFIYFGWVGLL